MPKETYNALSNFNKEEIKNSIKKLKAEAKLLETNKTGALMSPNRMCNADALYCKVSVP